MHSLSIFGTSSDAGKSTLSFVITYLLAKRSIKVAPFKAQNVSNNSAVCDLGGEVAQPQFFAAESIGLQTTPDFNPVLLKSGRKNSASLIVNGYSVSEQDVREYYQKIDTLKPVVESAFLRLQEHFEVIVAEGAGSPVELNLMKKDLSNIYIADRFQTKIILVADIERGGVFASIWGVYNLLPKELQKNVIGVIVNKFRGDRTLFDEGVQIIEQRFGLKVLGVLPYKPFNLGFEDSQSLLNYKQDITEAKVKVAVIKLPHISNFTDFEPLVLDKEIALHFINTPQSLSMYDVLIIPGTKRTVDDLLWLKKSGFEKAIKHFGSILVAICGGYQMMYERIIDEEGIESEHKSVAGFGLIAGAVTFQKEKVVTKGSYELFGMQLKGYEIHNGVAQTIGVAKENFYGTFLHGLFDNDAFRKELFQSFDYVGYDFNSYKRQKIESYATMMEEFIDMDSIVAELQE